MLAYNFSKLEKREARMYSIGDIKLSQKGLPYVMLGFCLGLEILSIIIHMGIQQALGVDYMFPIDWSTMSIKEVQLIFIYILPIAIGVALYKVKIQGFKLFHFLILLVFPRKTLSAQGKAFKRSEVKVNAFLENQH